MSVSDALIRRSSRARRWLGLTAAIVITMTLTAGSASATVVERERVFKNPYEFIAWDCGYPMQVVGVETHLIHVRADRQGRRQLLLHEQLRVAGNVDGGGRSVVHDLGQRDLQGRQGPSRSAVRCTNSSSTRTVSRSSSRTRLASVISRDRGNFTGSYTFDFGTGEFNYLGDRAPWTASDVRCRPVPGRGTAHGDQ